jgi:hypothetical protein
VTRSDGPVSDALVDTYRDLLRIKAGLADSTPAPTGPTPGTGRGCRPGRSVPGKRLRNWHRIANSVNTDKLSLRAFARGLAANGSSPSARELQAVAKAWLASKGARP